MKRKWQIFWSMFLEFGLLFHGSSSLRVHNFMLQLLLYSSVVETSNLCINHLRRNFLGNKFKFSEIYVFIRFYSIIICPLLDTILVSPCVIFTLCTLIWVMRVWCAVCARKNFRLNHQNYTQTNFVPAFVAPI